jgi:hypothetical protein
MVAALPLLCGCSDDLESDAPGTLTITLVSNTQTVVTRSAEDVEYLIGKTYFYFYSSTDEDVASVYHITQTLNGNSEATLKLQGTDSYSIFPGTAQKRYVYAVTNLPDEVASELPEKPTISQIKSLLLNSEAEFQDTVQITSFVMAGIAEVTKDASGNLSSTIELRRAAAKVVVTISAPLKSTVSSSVYYEPIFALGDAEGTDFDVDNYSPQIELYNAAYTGVVHGEATGDSLKLYAKALTRPLTKLFSTEEKVYYSHQAFYLYPSSWQDGDGHDVHLSLAIPWRKTETNSDGSMTRSVVWFYYQLPIKNNGNEKTNQVTRNYFYNINLSLGIMEGALTGDVVTPDPSQLSYEIADWTDDGAKISAVLDRSHYLVVQDNAFELYNVDELSFEYQSCNSVTAYVTEVKYYSTKYGEDIYLYKAEYDQTNNKYNEVNSYADISTNNATVRKDNSDLVATLKTNAETTGNMLTVTAESSETTEAVNGLIKFYSPVANLAEHFYRPIIYTIVVVNDQAHNSIRQTVTITQYPSKYVEFGDCDNVFVNGYYARATSGTVENKTYGYQSYPFLYTSYTTVNASDGTYYNTSTSYATSKVQDFGYISNEDTQITDLSAVMTSYEYIQGTVQSDLTLNHTVDVHVTAFTAYDRTFSLYNPSSGASLTYTYRLGDSRVDGDFTAYDHSGTDYTSSYTRGDDVKWLYDYYVKGVVRKDTTVTTNSGQGGNDSGGSNPGGSNPGDSGPGNSGGGPSFAPGPNDSNSNPGGGSNSNTVTTITTYYDRYLKSWGDDAAEIKVGGTDASYDNIISPLYKIQSPYGALIGSAYYDVAQKRCATYQEAGYPAGRWRLPTLAEVAFIVYLQSQNVIEPMFVTNTTGYWTSSGGRVFLYSSNSYYTENYKSSTDSKCFVRCVYDLWYWGSDPVEPVDEYHPMPTK